MSAKHMIWVVLFFSSTLQAQFLEPASKTENSPSRSDFHPLALKENSVQPVMILDTPKNVRPRRYDRYGDLLDDDPLYNLKSDIPVPIYKVLIANVEVWAIDRYVFNYDYSRIGFNSWSNNIKRGWEWDNDRFGINFFGHPYTGGGYFNAGRSTGYSFYECIPFAAWGSLLWEYFGETTRPSYSDFINTTINGTFGGEILYRLGSNVLDDQTTGAERVFREAAAAILSPSRFTSRLFQGKLFRVAPEEEYQKEVLNTTMYGGAHLINKNNSFGTGSPNVIIGLQFEYGNPFEERDRKPFDFFKLRGEMNFGVGRKVMDNVTGYGLLFGKNTGDEGSHFLFGGFQQYDYWDNNIFELGAFGIGAGLISKFDISGSSNLYTTLHLAFVPLAGNSSIHGPDSSEVRDYNYGGGAETELESILSFGTFAKLSVLANYYWVHTYVGLPGNNFVGILEPKLTVQLFKDVSIGLEHIVYYDDRYPRNAPDDSRPIQHFVRTEQKVFLQVYFENSRRGGSFY
ncbi:MAG: DUF3943 domain-containing protein [Bacteroidota bacterium]|nr:DUF3943 domain-containing protein [Bacteroidota bacterium]